MATLREIKRRITSVNNIAQVTNAMQLVAASRMRKAQENAQKGKLYAQRLREMMVQLSLNKTLNVDPMIDPTYTTSKNVYVLVFSPQRGLAGALPGNLTRFTIQFVRELEKNGYSVQLITIGRKVRDQLVFGGHELVADFSDIPEVPTTADVRPILKMITEGYLQHDAGKVFMIYPDFVNPMVQMPTAQTLLPLDIETLELAEEEFDKTAGVVQTDAAMIFEPDMGSILSELIPQYLETQIFQKRLETIASEYSARMVAMKNATENAKELKEDLTIEFNKSRQAIITRELAEISAARVSK